MNKAIVAGRLTRDPELKALPSGANVCNFSVATSYVYTDKSGQKKEQAEFHNVVAFGKSADLVAKWFKKGAYIVVEGRLQTRNWEKDGVKQYRTEIIADRVEFGPKTSGDSGGGSSRGASNGSAPEEDFGPAQSSSPAGIEYPKDEINPEDIPF